MWVARRAREDSGFTFSCMDRKKWRRAVFPDRNKGGASVSNNTFDQVKVFSATKAGDRIQLGERVTSWLREHPELEVICRVVTQSSDRAFHCIAITLFMRTAEAS